MVHEYLWQTQNPVGWEHVRINNDHPGWDVFDSVLVRLDGDKVRRGGYTLVIDKTWRSLEIRCLIETEPGVMASVHLLSEGNGVWFDENEQPVPELDGCLDIAIDGSPLSLTIPLRRLDMQDGQATDFRVVEISLLDLSIQTKDVRLIRNGSMIQYDDEREAETDADGFVRRSTDGIERAFPD